MNTHKFKNVEVHNPDGNIVWFDYKHVEQKYTSILEKAMERAVYHIVYGQEIQGVKERKWEKFEEEQLRFFLVTGKREEGYRDIDSSDYYQEERSKKEISYKDLMELFQ